MREVGKPCTWSESRWHPVHVVSVRQSEFEPAAGSGGDSATEEVAVVADPASDKIEFLGVDVVKGSTDEKAGEGKE